MIRLFNVYYPTRTLVLMASEALIVWTSVLLAVVIKFRQDYFLMLNYEYGFYKVGVACGIFLLCMYYYDLYDSLIFCKPSQLLTRLLQVLGTTCLVAALVYYVFPEVQLEATLLALALAFIGLFLVVWREVFMILSRSSRLASRALVLGAGPLAPLIGAEIEQHAEWGLRLQGYVGRPLEWSENLPGLRRLGDTSDLIDVVERERIDEVIVTLGERRGQLPFETLLRLKAKGVQIRDGVDFYETFTGKVPLDSLRLSWLLFSPGFQFSRAGLVYKRIASVFLAFAGLVLTLPLMALIAVAIRLDSRGRILFRQERVGKDGGIFKLNKFRTMRDGLNSVDQSRPAQENDTRVTRVGRLLRRTRLDELPQLYNILRGDMHFVGPRPFVPKQEEECAQAIPHYRQRWVVRPGATGWAQVNRSYCATVEDNVEKLGYDLFYIKNMSIGLDLLIVFRTIKTLILGRGGR